MTSSFWFCDFTAFELDLVESLGNPKVYNSKWTNQIMHIDLINFTDGRN